MKNETIAKMNALQLANQLTDMELFQAFGLSIGASQVEEARQDFNPKLFRRGLDNMDKELWDFRSVDRMGLNTDVPEKLEMNTKEGRKKRVAELEAAYKVAEAAEISPFEHGYDNLM